MKYSSPQPPFSALQTPKNVNISNEKETATSSFISRISPLILLVLIILTVIFFIYGLIQLVLWFLMKIASSSTSLYNSNRFQESTRTRAFHRQLQQLFHLHDSGLDQALIDTLPLFNYKALMGLKEPFDCAVCLCEFSDQDQLRLVPMCSHAFHMNCLDTWLLSNSTCPLCRANVSSSSSFLMQNVENSKENIVECSEYSEREITAEEQRVFSVRLGKFRNNGIVEDGSCSLDERRCYSMGSYQYELCNSNLQVVLLSQSSCCDDKLGSEENGNVEGKRVGTTIKGESFSVSKIWLWSKKSKFPSSGVDFP
ncbi:RING-H2 finger protein ATL46-like [Cicer arietinum]|uniref:RING-type E3 ubiquitin transferase n=1 Tax=Cicer arietinum TaxID=3827 RepID=A0A1S2YRN8_CICAR|nr:RING-H2 finger protein ATL47-like [Cicer arietinum]